MAKAFTVGLETKKRVFDKDEMKILSWYKVLDLDITEIEMLLNYDSWDENTEHLLTERSNDDRQSAFYIFDHLYLGNLMHLYN